jgi:hypothetical protein
VVALAHGLLRLHTLMTSRPHDALFKLAFEAPADATALLRELLPPAIGDAVVWETLDGARGSFVDRRLADRHVDLLFSARLRAGRPGVIFLLLEHQSTADLAMPQRILAYQIRIWDRFRKHRPRAPLPPVFAVLVSHVPGGWSAPRAFEDLFDPEVMAIPGLAALVPRCSMVTLDLTPLTNAELQARSLAPFQKLALWALRDARDPKRLLASFDAWRPTLADAGRTRSGRDALSVLIEYLVEVLDPVYWDELRAKLYSLDPSSEEATMTIADMFREEGRITTLRATLRSLLLFKFQALDAASEARVQAAAPEAIDRYLQRLLTADSLAAVFED